MCGIVGLFDTQATAPVDPRLLESMNQTQFHRGPDEGGTFIDPGIGLGHRRLSIIDLSSGQQPLFNEDGGVVVVFNGEIYNYVDLIPELQALGHTFRTRSDTEVIVHAWEQWGEACVERFRGMFAFALWDKRAETLFLARDRLGVKPLYYALLNDGSLIFGSELKALLAHPALAREIDPLAVEDYFAYGYVAEPRTIFKQARKLPPAHTLSWVRGRRIPVIKPYWDVPFKPLGAISLEEAKEELVRRLREAVRIRLVSEVPLGAFLSGGVDSSAVVAMMAGLMNEPVNTCSISFGDPAFNESAYALQVAQRYGTRHRVEQVNADDFDLIDQLALLYDEPFADSSALPTYRVCQLARKQVTVALSGDGGDETFAGYRRYGWHLEHERLRSLFPSFLRRSVFRGAAAVYPRLASAPRFLRAKSTLRTIAETTLEGYFRIIAMVKDDVRKDLFSPAFHRALGGYSALDLTREHAARAPTDDPLALAQYLDMKLYLPGDILTKVDRASMAHALEVREPLLDHSLMEWASGLPPGFKRSRAEGKLVFKQAMEPFLPSEVLYRPKMGFAVPLASWFRGPLAQRLAAALLGPTLQETGLFNMACIRRLLSEHQSKRVDHSATLWSLLMFESFVRQIQQGDSPIQEFAA